MPRTFFDKYIIPALIWFGVNGLWFLLEYMFYGQLRSSLEDTIIAVILTISLGLNYYLMQDTRRN